MHHYFRRKALILCLIYFFFGVSIFTSIEAGYSSRTKENIHKLILDRNREILFEDDFNDNSKDESKWEHYWQEGEWFERNQRTELYFYDTHPSAVQEGIISIPIPVTLSDSYSVKLSVDMISELFSTVDTGQLFFSVEANGAGILTACYDRESGHCKYQDSNDADWTILGFHSEWIWSNEIILCNNRYRVTMGSFDGGWVYDSLFSPTFEIIMRLSISLDNNEASNWQAGFDNALVQGLNSVNQPPDADFHHTPLYPNPGESVTFNASFSSDYNGYITLYEWDWDNNGVVDESTANPFITHSWSTKGVYNVSLTVIDNESLNETICKQIKIGSNMMLYVGGVGANNYSQIQDAINIAGPGDTVYVYNESSPYNEPLTITKSIALIGEHENTTIINGSSALNAVNILSDQVILSHFTIINNANYPWHNNELFIDSDHCLISHNIIRNIEPISPAFIYGIFLRGTHHTINNNSISDVEYGIIHGDGNTIISNNNLFDIQHDAISIAGNNNVISMNQITDAQISVLLTGHHNSYGKNNTVTMNTHVITESDRTRGCTGMVFGGIERSNISHNTIDMLVPVNNNPDWHSDGIHIDHSRNITVYGNNIANCYRGISVIDSSNVTTSLNNITDSWYGIIHEVSDPNITCGKKRVFSKDFNLFAKSSLSDPINQANPHRIKKNNFIRVLFPARSLFVILADLRDTSVLWEENYWGRSRTLPKIIISFFNINPSIEEWGIPAKIEFDLKPAQEPYEIPNVAI